MSRLFNRKYDLTIIPPDSTEGKVIKDLRIVFKVTKSIISTPNLCEITLYGINDNTAALLEKKYTNIILNAGYESKVRLIYKGQIKNTFISKLGTEHTATIYCGDGEAAWESAIFNKTIASNVTIKSAIKDIVATFSNVAQEASKVIEGDTSALDSITDRLEPQTLIGSSKDILDKMAKDYGFEWSIQDSEVVILNEEQTLADTQAILIRADTGMIGSPTVTEIGADVVTLLNPDALPNKLIKIESASQDVAIQNAALRPIRRTKAEGLYKILEVVFSGDSRGDMWQSQIKGRLVNG